MGTGATMEKKFKKVSSMPPQRSPQKAPITPQVARQQSERVKSVTKQLEKSASNIEILSPMSRDFLRVRPSPGESKTPGGDARFHTPRGTPITIAPYSSEKNMEQYIYKYRQKGSQTHLQALLSTRKQKRSVEKEKMKCTEPEPKLYVYDDDSVVHDQAELLCEQEQGQEQDYWTETENRNTNSRGYQQQGNSQRSNYGHRNNSEKYDQQQYDHQQYDQQQYDQQQYDQQQYDCGYDEKDSYGDASGSRASPRRRGQDRQRGGYDEKSNYEDDAQHYRQSYGRPPSRSSTRAARSLNHQSTRGPQSPAFSEPKYDEKSGYGDDTSAGQYDQQQYDQQQYDQQQYDQQQYDQQQYDQQQYDQEQYDQQQYDQQQYDQQQYDQQQYDQQQYDQQQYDHKYDQQNDQQQYDQQQYDQQQYDQQQYDQQQYDQQQYDQQQYDHQQYEYTESTIPEETLSSQIPYEYSPEDYADSHSFEYPPSARSDREKQFSAREPPTTISNDSSAQDGISTIDKANTARTDLNATIALNSVEEIESLFSKIRHGRTGAVKDTLADGFNPNAVDEMGNTMLHVCCQNNLRKMAGVAIASGCPVNEVNNKGLTPLDYCHQFNFDELGDWIASSHGALPFASGKFTSQSIPAKGGGRSVGGIPIYVDDYGNAVNSPTRARSLR